MEEKPNKDDLRLERKIRNAKEELAAINNEIQASKKIGKKGKANKVDSDVVKYKSDRQILRGRNNNEKKRRRSMNKIDKISARTWLGWRAYEKPFPVITYNLDDLNKDDPETD